MAAPPAPLRIHSQKSFSWSVTSQGNHDAAYLRFKVWSARLLSQLLLCSRQKLPPQFVQDAGLVPIPI